MTTAAPVPPAVLTGTLGPGTLPDPDARGGGGLGLRDVVVRFRAGRGGGLEGAERDPRVRDGWLVAVDGVSLGVGRGEVVALLGPSGCGKSSLLRAVAGLEPLAAGDVRWDGESVAAVPTHRRGFGLMFQDGQLFVHRDVAGNVAYGLARLPRAEQAERVAELLELVGLAGYERREVTTLSGGERQRVALARSLAPRPRLLMLDEPLSALDRALRERLTGEIAGILRRAGTTALYVTHDHAEARAVADRVGIMIAGRLEQVGTPDEVWAVPANAAVAHFLG